MRGSEEVRRLDPATMSPAGLSSAMAVRADDRNKPWNIHIRYRDRPLHFRHTQHKVVPDGARLQCRYFFSATPRSFRTSRHTDPLCPQYNLIQKDMPMICQLRGGPDDLPSTSKPPKPLSSLMTADLPGARPAPGRRPRAPRSAPEQLLTSQPRRAAGRTEASGRPTTREGSGHAAPAGQFEGPAMPCGTDAEAAQQHVVHVPLDVSDIVVPRRRFATRVPCTLTTEGIDTSARQPRPASREALREYAARNSREARERAAQHGVSAAHAAPRDRSSRGLAQFGRGSRGQGGGSLSSPLERGPDFRPKVTSSFPGTAGVGGRSGSGACGTAPKAKQLRSNGTGMFPPTTAHKHVFATGRNVRVHEMPPRIRGDS